MIKRTNSLKKPPKQSAISSTKDLFTYSNKNSNPLRYSQRKIHHNERN